MTLRDMGRDENRLIQHPKPRRHSGTPGVTGRSSPPPDRLSDPSPNHWSSVQKVAAPASGPFEEADSLGLSVRSARSDVKPGLTDGYCLSRIHDPLGSTAATGAKE